MAEPLERGCGRSRRDGSGRSRGRTGGRRGCHSPRRSWFRSRPWPNRWSAKLWSPPGRWFRSSPSPCHWRRKPLSPRGGMSAADEVPHPPIDALAPGNDVAELADVPLACGGRGARRRVRGRARGVSGGGSRPPLIRWRPIGSLRQPRRSTPPRARRPSPTRSRRPRGSSRRTMPSSWRPRRQRRRRWPTSRSRPRWPRWRSAPVRRGGRTVAGPVGARAPGGRDRPRPAVGRTLHDPERAGPPADGDDAATDSAQLRGFVLEAELVTEQWPHARQRQGLGHALAAVEAARWAGL